MRSTCFRTYSACAVCPVISARTNGPEFIAKAVQDWIAAVGPTTAYIELGSPWENGYCVSFNAKLRDELLNGEVFYTLKEASVVIEQWRRHYNSIRPHSSLGYHPPAPEVVIWPTEPSSSAPLAQPAIVTRPAPDPANWSALNAIFRAS